VRAPEHRATILLHCERFAGADYTSLLNPDCQPQSVLRSDTDFHEWLDKLDAN